MIFGINSLSFWIAAGIFGALALAPLIYLGLGWAHKLTSALSSDLKTRYKSWLILAPLMVLPVLAGPLAAILAIGVLAVFCYREFARATGAFRERAISVVVVIGIGLETYAAADGWYGLFVALPSLVISALVVVALFADEPKGYIQRVALGIFAFVLFGVCLNHLGFLSNNPMGQPLLLLTLLCVELNDVFAYCCGKLFGRRKLAPQTSPNKTLGGSLGALVLTTTLFATLARPIFAATPLDQTTHLIVLGALLSVVGQFGDLVLSSVKRDLGIKDMAATIPGHGGLLDRFDSLLFVGPVLFHYVRYFS